MIFDDAPLPGLAVRARRAAQDIAEALSLMRVEAPLQAAPGQQGGAPAPQPMPQPARPAQGPLATPQGPGGMPVQRPAMSPPLAMPMPRSQPVAAALQGAVGREGPIGFAAGGYVDFAVRR